MPTPTPKDRRLWDQAWSTVHDTQHPEMRVYDILVEYEGMRGLLERMEAVGMDVYTMATRAGWDIYPIGERTPPSDLPCGLFLGIVLVY